MRSPQERDISYYIIPVLSSWYTYQTFNLLNRTITVLHTNTQNITESYRKLNIKKNTL
jgi:hypothetical protein